MKQACILITPGWAIPPFPLLLLVDLILLSLGAKDALLLLGVEVEVDGLDLSRLSTGEAGIGIDLELSVLALCPSLIFVE